MVTGARSTLIQWSDKDFGVGGSGDVQSETWQGRRIIVAPRRSLLSPSGSQHTTHSRLRTLESITKNPEPLEPLRDNGPQWRVCREQLGHRLGVGQRLRPLTTGCWELQALGLLVFLQTLTHAQKYMRIPPSPCTHNSPPRVSPAQGLTSSDVPQGCSRPRPTPRGHKKTLEMHREGFQSAAAFY